MLNWLLPYNCMGLQFRNHVKLAPLSHSVIHAAVFMALYNPTYLAVKVNMELVICFWLDHETAPPARVKTYL